MCDFEQMMLYYMWSADEIAQNIANSSDPANPVIQRRICRKYGVELDDLPDDIIDYLSNKVNYYLNRGY